MAGILQWCSSATSPSPTTQALRAILQDSGANDVTLISQDAAVPADLSPYKVSVTDGSVDGTILGTKLRALVHPVVVTAGGEVPVNMSMTPVIPSTRSTNNIDIVDDTHPLANGHSGEDIVITFGDRTQFCRNSDATANIRIALAGTSSVLHVLVAWEPGQSMVSSFLAPARRVWYGVSADAVNNATPTGQGIILNNVRWAGEFGPYGSSPLKGGVLSSSAMNALVVGTPVTDGEPPYTYQWYLGSTPGFVPNAGNELSGETGEDMVAAVAILPLGYNEFARVATDNLGAQVIDRYVIDRTGTTGPGRVSSRFIRRWR